MSNVKVRINIKLATILYVSTLVYVLFFYNFFNIEKSTIIYSVLHAMMASTLLYRILSNCLNVLRLDKLNITKMTILIASMYFYMSSIKYSQEKLYAYFITDNTLRLLGSFVVFISIYYAAHCEKEATKNIVNPTFSLELSDKFYILIVICFFYTLYDLRYNTASYSYETLEIKSTSGQIVTLFRGVLTYMSILIVTYKFDRKRFKSWFFLCVVMLIPTFSSFSTGSRSAMLSPLMVILFALVLFKKMLVKWFILAISVFPIVYLTLTRIVWQTSSRFINAPLSLVARDLSYRFDYSDFPMTILEKKGLFYVDFRELLDGITISIPSIFGLSKSVNGEAQFLGELGFPPNVDFTDSLFSMGTVTLGIIGFICMLPVMVSIYGKIETYLSKKSKYGLVYRFTCFSLFVAVEATWFSYIPSIRNAIISVIIAKIIYNVVKSICWRRQGRAYA